MDLTLAGFPDGTNVADLTDVQLEAWAQQVIDLSNSSDQSTLPDEPRGVLAVIDDGRSATVTSEQQSLWLHRPDSSRSGPFDDLPSVAAAHPGLFEVREGSCSRLERGTGTAWELVVPVLSPQASPVLSL